MRAMTFSDLIDFSRSHTLVTVALALMVVVYESWYPMVLHQMAPGSRRVWIEEEDFSSRRVPANLFDLDLG